MEISCSGDRVGQEATASERSDEIAVHQSPRLRYPYLGSGEYNDRGKLLSYRVGAAALFLLALAACAQSAPTPTATPTPAPTSTPTLPAPTPTATPLPVPTPSPSATAPVELVRYTNELYGVQLERPGGWTRIDTPLNPGLLVEFQAPGEEDGPSLGLSLVYVGGPITAAQASDQIVASLAVRPGFRTLSEAEVSLGDADDGFQVTYSYGLTPNEIRGSLVTAVRGSQAFILLLESDRQSYEANLDLFQQSMEGLRLVEPRPFGFPREELLVLFMDEPSRLDPAQVQTSLNVQHVSQIFDGLVAFTPDLELVPNLARSWRESGDGTVYTFNLDPDARFHNGRSVTAQDVKDSWERATDLALDPLSAETYLGDIVGFQEKLEGAAQELSGVRVINDLTLEVTIDAPKTYFLSKLTHPVAYVVNRENVESGSSEAGNEWWRHPVGTGPYRVAEWEPGTAMLLERHDAYHRGAAPVQWVVIRFYGGLPTRMFEDGEIDVATVGGRQALEELSQVGGPLLDELASVAELSVFYLGFDTTIPPFDDPKVRRAFLLATDRQRIIDEVIGESGQLAHAFLPPGMPGYDEETPSIPYDAEEAHRLLSETEYESAEGLPVVIYTPGPLGITIASLLLGMWQENLGVDIRVRFIPQGEYYDLLGEEKGNLYEYGWIADYPDPHNFLDVLFHSDSPDNRGEYSNAEVDELLEQARIEQDEATRLDLYRQVNRLLVEDVAAIPLYFSRSHILVRPYVKNFPLSSQGLIELRLVSLER